jgi:HAD superfamily hydrolase (TIGR01509 family)
MKALIFDFDGTIIDTEMPDYLAWQEVYQYFGHQLPLEKWASIVGGSSASNFDPYTYLETLVGNSIDHENLWIKKRQRVAGLIEKAPILPGIIDMLKAAKKLDMGLAIASSSSYSWVSGNLHRIGLFDYFDVICTSDDVVNTKPDPSLFLLAAKKLNVDPSEAIVFEDSPNGVLAANTAGIVVVAIPNPLTAKLDLSHADYQVSSLDKLPLKELLGKIEKS